jgi:putative hydrolase of the HAD superfamily
MLSILASPLAGADGRSRDTRSAYRAQYLWSVLGFSKHFDGMFYSTEIGHPKKDVRFLRHSIAYLEIDGSQRLLFFDDQPEILEIAKDAG